MGELRALWCLMVQLSVSGIVSARMSSMFTSSQKIWMYSAINISINLSQKICNILQHVIQFSVSVCTITVVRRREVRVELYLKMCHITTYKICLSPSWMVSYVFYSFVPPLPTLLFMLSQLLRKVEGDEGRRRPGLLERALNPSRKSYTNKKIPPFP